MKSKVNKVALNFLRNTEDIKYPDEYPYIEYFYSYLHDEETLSDSVTIGKDKLAGLLLYCNFLENKLSK